MEGFDRLVDRYHDVAYDTATDGSGKIWRKMHIPGHRKSVYVEQNPQNGEQAEIIDPAKDRLPSGWRVDRPQDPRDRRDTMQPDNQGYDRDRGRYDQREPPVVNDRDYPNGDNLDSPRKVRINPLTEVRLSRVTLSSCYPPCFHDC